jgi:ADP-dependent phosphofructokinase/glucokinase
MVLGLHLLTVHLYEYYLLQVAAVVLEEAVLMLKFGVALAAAQVAA